MNTIRNWLYIGKYRDTFDATLLAAHKIGAMLQLAEAVKHPSIESLYLPVEDGVPLADHHLRQGIDFMLGQKRLGRNVLVACGAGMSRSAAFAVAVLKEDEGLGLLDALRAVKSHHPDTMIHPVLWESLCVYYRENIPFLSASKAMNSNK
jgi:protein-tyrosine phosphatase